MYHGINILRGIAAFGIVGCHLGLYPRTSGGEWVTALCDFNVGLFAAVSGFLMADEGEWGGYVKKRAQRLLPTYFVWSMVYLVATALFDLALDGGKLNDRYYSLSNWLRVLFCGSAAAHLWFLICLFYGQFLLKGLVEMLKLAKATAAIQRGTLVVVSLLLLFCSVCDSNWYCMYPIRLFSFLLLGYVMKGYSKNWVAIPLAGVMAMLAVHLGAHGILPGFVRDYLLAVPMLMLFVSKVFPENRLGTFLAGTSMGVYLVHPLIARGTSFAVARLLASPYNGFVVACQWVVVWSVSLAAVVVLRKLPLCAKFLK